MRCRRYNLRINLLKCACRVSSRKLLGFIVHRKGIDLDPSNAKANRDMKPPKTIKQLKSFLGSVSYIRRFISALAELLEPFKKLLKKDVSFQWARNSRQPS